MRSVRCKEGIGAVKVSTHGNVYLVSKIMLFIVDSRVIGKTRTLYVPVYPCLGRELLRTE